MTTKETLQAIIKLIAAHFENEVDNVAVINIRGVQVLRWSYQSPYTGLDAVEDVSDSVNIFLTTVGEFIDEQGLLTAVEATDTDYGIVDYVLDEASLKAYNQVYENIWKGVS